MGNSNQKILRKKFAQECADEIFTINTEIDNITERLKNIDYKNLTKLNLSDLKRIRQELQHLKRNINRVNYGIDEVTNQRHKFGFVTIKTCNDEPDGLPNLLVDNRLLK